MLEGAVLTSCWKSIDATVVSATCGRRNSPCINQILRKYLRRFVGFSMNLNPRKIVSAALVYYKPASAGMFSIPWHDRRVKLMFTRSSQSEAPICNYVIAHGLWHSSRSLKSAPFNSVELPPSTFAQDTKSHQTEINNQLN